MHKDIYTKIMITKKIIASASIIIFLSGCSLSPGMHFSSDSSVFEDQDYVFIESLEKNIYINNISSNNADINKLKSDDSYKIGIGDQIAITVWGLPEIFPVTNINPDQNLRRVDSNGDIFFPYAGNVKALGKSQNELRDDLTELLSESFTKPQLDVSIARFNSQQVYLLGEITRPLKLNLTDVPLSLADAIGQANGLNTSTSDGANVFVIRQSSKDNEPAIFRANLNSPAGFIDAGKFYLLDGDIVYVNAKGTTRWNRVISQFFPFSSFLNSIDNLTNND